MTDKAFYEIWEVDPASSKRQVHLLMDHLVMPYYRQTQRSKFADPRAKAYNAWADALRTEIADVMRRENIKPFPDDARLELTAMITLAPKTINVWSKNKQHGRTVHPVETQDCDNLLKGLVDAAQGALFGNDRRIFHVCGRKQEGAQDGFYLWVKVQ